MELSDFTKDELIMYIRSKFHQPKLNDLLLIRNNLLIKKWELRVKNSPSINDGYHKWNKYQEESDRLYKKIEDIWSYMEGKETKII
jgi:hypothetical protein